MILENLLVSCDWLTYLFPESCTWMDWLIGDVAPTIRRTFGGLYVVHNCRNYRDSKCYFVRKFVLHESDSIGIREPIKFLQMRVITHSTMWYGRTSLPHIRQFDHGYIEELKRSQFCEFFYLVSFGANAKRQQWGLIYFITFLVF